jgi:hypothetical protein
MPTPKYPLDPLLKHRNRRVDDAKASLGDAVRAREAAEAAVRRAEAARRQAEDRAARVRAEEQKRLARGELRAVDLARGDAWELAARAEIDRLASAVEEAEKNERRARDAEEDARAALARTMADRDVVRKDEARFQQRVAKAVLAAEEEAAEEAFRGGRR